MNVLIAGQDAVRRKLMPLLQAEFGELVVRQAKNASEVIGGFSDGNWDLIFLDIRMPGPNIADVLRQLRERNPKVPVLVLVGLSEAEPVLHTLSIGANGHGMARPLPNAFVPRRAVTVGDIDEGPETVKGRTAQCGEDRRCTRHRALSVREFEVFCLIAQGKAIKEIAFDLLVSGKTVATYLARIKEKMGLENHVDIARYAFQNGLVR